MLDAPLRRLAGPQVERAGAFLARSGVSPQALTLMGLVVGLSAIPALAAGAYHLALALIFANRLADLLDGAVARHGGASDFGGFLDIVCDFVFYSGIVFGFALAGEANRLPAAWLLFSFMGTAASFLAFAAVAAKHGLSSERHGRKSLYFLGGLTEGTETTVFFVVSCLAPDWFPALAYGFGALCSITALTRAWTARGLLRGRDSPARRTGNRVGDHVVDGDD